MQSTFCTAGVIVAVLVMSLQYCFAADIPPDIVVAADGSGQFATVHEAVQSIPKDNSQRIVVLIMDGTYKEKVRIDAACVTLRGQSRQGTRIEFPQLNEEFDKKPDELGRAVLNLKGDDFVLQNLTVVNTAGIVGPHSFAIYGTGDRTVIVDCDVLSEGADTVSLWQGKSGRYYHAGCNFRGAVDFVCPRGWCYVADSTFYETKKGSAAVWHDGKHDRNMKFVMRSCQFDGVDGWVLSRHHHDAQFFFLDCTFSKSMADKPPRRVVYADNPERNAELDKTNLWGERAYFSNCHRDGGDYAWHDDNLTEIGDAPKPQNITAAWTFDGTWDPERIRGPVVQKIQPQPDRIVVTFSESVTVKGKPALILQSSRIAEYASGSGGATLTFATPAGDTSAVTAVDLNGGLIVQSEAAATILPADLTLPGK